MKKKILFFIHNMNVGGTERALLSLIEVLRKDFNIDVLMLEKSGGLLQEIPTDVNIIEIQNKKDILNFINIGPKVFVKELILKRDYIKAIKGLFIYFLWKLTDDFVLNYKLIDTRIIKQEVKYDIAVSYAGPHHFISNYILKNVTAKLKVQWIHFDVSKIPFSKATYRKLFLQYDQINVVSEYSRQKLIEMIPGIKSKAKVSHNIIHKDDIAEKSDENNPFDSGNNVIDIVTVARLTKEKGHTIVLPAIKRLKQEGYVVRWSIVGGGEEYSSLKKEIKQLELLEEVKLLGERSNPYPYMKYCKIYLQPSFHEGYGITIAEAKIFNVPIVSTKTTGAMEQLKDNYNGILVDINSEGIYEGIKQIIDNESLRKSIIHNLKNEGCETVEYTSIF
ncbi:MAG: glycosyltransferase [Carboxylicivirga sp.]|nr:glycosyltransferase [Carboxylicivirga sp.]